MTREHGATGENGVNPHREGADAVSTEKKQVLIDKKYRNGPGSSQILESIKKMDDAALVETISYERKRLNDLAQKALEDGGNLDVETVREQNRVVESLLNEAVLRRIEGFEEQNR